MNSLLVSLIILLCFLPFIQICFAYNYFSVYIKEYFNGQKSSWNPKYDRIAFFGVVSFFIMSILIIYVTFNYSYDNLYMFFIYILLMFLATFLIIMLIYITKNIRKNKNNKDKYRNASIISNCTVKINDEYVKIIYYILKQYKYINNEIEECQFIEYFLKKPIVLNMSVPSFRYFYNFLIHNFDIHIKPGEFCKLFINEYNKKIYNIEQFSKSQNPIPKNYKEMNEIFEKILKNSCFFC